MTELIDKYFAKQITREEKKILFECMDADETLKKEFHQMQNATALAGMLPHPEDREVSQKGWERFTQMIFRRQLKHTLILSSKYAAAFALLIVVTFLVTRRYLSAEHGKSYTVVTAPKGQRVKVDLPDGTVAWLSPCSQIRFSGSFNKKNRSVELDGATFFDVAKNPEKPFIVSVKNYRVEVLGTKFNISAYSGSSEFEADLVEGSVHIYDADNRQNEVFLQPQEKAVLRGDRLVKRTSDFNNEEYLKNGVVSFQSEPFGRVINSVSLWNDVKFTVAPSMDMTKKISGKFRQSDSVESILKALQGVITFKYKVVSENEIAIY